MGVQFVSQPHAVVRLGDYLSRQLMDARWTEFRAAIAFVQESGTQFLAAPLKHFARREHTTIKISVGIDLEGSSRGGLLELLESIGDGEVWIFHNTNNYTKPTFHPKVYLFRNNEQAEVVIGSGNLTAGGLFTNYEASFVVSLDLLQPNDATLLKQVESVLDTWSSSSSGTVRLLTRDLLDDLVARGGVPDEQKARLAADERGVGTGTGQAQTLNDLFESAPVPPPPPKPGGRQSAATPTRTNQRDVDSQGVDAGYRQQTSQTTSPMAAPTQSAAPTQAAHAGRRMLIRLVPKAGGRTSQVHFSSDEAHNYFHLAQGQQQRVRLQEIDVNAGLQDIEVRRLVYSEKNKNYKIEVSGAGDLSKKYPSGGDRPVLVFEEVERNLFRYVLLLPGDDGHAQLQAHLLAMPRVRALQSTVMTLGELRTLWPAYPVTP